ncbi:hypothetical protein [Defluviimonas sp. SAOS-178_SWC]|uniref:hypothetical protein n=1 Tax=Defluviimonas sp. SAOS-178_SWC TaxID=3121287 RepID=UPI003221E0DC
MGRILVIGGAIVGAYALWAGQNPGRAFKPSVPAALFSPSSTSAGSVGSAAVGVAGRMGN